MEMSTAKWIVFLGIIFIILMIDLGLFNKKDHEIEVKESLYLSGFYILLALLFGGWIYYQFGGERAEEYYTGYFIEKTLSLDNIFLISIVFNFLHIPRIYQHRVLFWGILGVIVLRGIMIGLGAILVSQYSWVLYIFSVFLIITGIKMFYTSSEPIDLEHNRFINFLITHLRTTKELNGHDFFVKKVDPSTNKKKIYCTPLFVALIIIETIDLIFAIDSVPAIFAITTDTYIVYTSNIFAILGLRALYFALAAMLNRFQYLKYALATLLVFIGAKIFIADFMGWHKFPAQISLIITLAIIATGVIFSLYKTKEK